MMKRKNGKVTPFRNAEFLPAYYAIPERIMKQCGKELNSIPRNPQAVIHDYDAFLLFVVSCHIHISQQPHLLYKKNLLQN